MANRQSDKQGQQGSNPSQPNQDGDQLSQQIGTSEPSQHGSRPKSRQQQQSPTRDASLDVDDEASSPAGPSGSSS